MALEFWPFLYFFMHFLLFLILPSCCYIVMLQCQIHMSNYCIIWMLLYFCKTKTLCYQKDAFQITWGSMMAFMLILFPFTEKKAIICLLAWHFLKTLYKFGIDVILQRGWKEQEGIENFRNLQYICSHFLSDLILPLEIWINIPLVIYSHRDNLREKKVLSDKDNNAEFN